jgi:hypothetical protein
MRAWLWVSYSLFAMHSCHRHFNPLVSFGRERPLQSAINLLFLSGRRGRCEAVALWHCLEQAHVLIGSGTGASRAAAVRMAVGWVESMVGTAPGSEALRHSLFFWVRFLGVSCSELFPSVPVSSLMFVRPWF